MVDATEAAAQTARILEELAGLLRPLMRIAGEEAAGVNVTPTQRIALFEIANSGPLRLNDLAGRIGTSVPTASRTVEALDGLGLVRRVPDPRDRRALQIDLTSGGRAQVAERQRRVTTAFAPAVTALDEDEVSGLVTMLSRLRDAFSAEIDMRRSR